MFCSWILFAYIRCSASISSGSLDLFSFNCFIASSIFVGVMNTSGSCDVMLLEFDFLVVFPVILGVFKSFLPPRFEAQVCFTFRLNAFSPSFVIWFNYCGKKNTVILNSFEFIQKALTIVALIFYCKLLTTQLKVYNKNRNSRITSNSSVKMLLNKFLCHTMVKRKSITIKN